jgi:hypothetical protein
MTYCGAATGTRNDALFWTISTEAATAQDSTKFNRVCARFGSGCRMFFARVGDETHPDPHLNLRKSNRLFPIKTNLGYPPAALPAMLQLLSPDSETLFNGNPEPMS